MGVGKMGYQSSGTVPNEGHKGTRQANYESVQ